MLEEKNKLIILYLLIICLVCLLQIILTNKADVYTYPSWHDIQSYRNMAIFPLSSNASVCQPFAYRIFAPWLVSIFFNDVDFGYFFFNSFFLIVFSIVFFFFLIEYKLNEKIAFFITLIFLSNRYFVPFYIFEFYRISDIISVTLILFCLILLNRNHIFLVIILSGLGILSRETMLLIIPIGITFLIEKGKKKETIEFGILSIILILIFLLPRILIHTNCGVTLYEAFEDNKNKIFSSEALLKQLFLAYNPLFLIPLTVIKEAVLFLKKNKWIIVLFFTTLAISFLGYDKERLMFPFAPAYYLIIGFIFQDIKFMHKSSNFNLMLITILCFIFNFHHIWGIVLLPNKIWSFVLAIIGSIVLLMVIQNMNFCRGLYFKLFEIFHHYFLKLKKLIK